MNSWIHGLASVLLGAAAGMASADALQVRSMAASCAACHGADGVSQPGMESLAGQSQEDLRKKLMDFKTGKTPATIMTQLAKGYSDEQLAQLASYFSAQKR